MYNFGIVQMEAFTNRKSTDEIFVGELNSKQWVASSLFPDATVNIVDCSLLGTKEDNDFLTKRNCFIIHFELISSLLCRIPRRK